MKWLSLSPKQQIIVIGVVFALLLILFVALLVVPKVLEVSTLGLEEQDALSQLNAAKTTYSQLEEMRKSSRKTDYDFMQLDKQAPEGAELPALLVQINDISTKSGIGFLSIKPTEPVQKDDYQEVPLEITIDAYFFSLLDFIYRLEKLPRVINVYGIDIKEGKAKLPNVEVTVRANAYITTPGVNAQATGAAVVVPAAAPAGATP